MGAKGTGDRKANKADDKKEKEHGKVDEQALLGLIRALRAQHGGNAGSAMGGKAMGASARLHLHSRFR